jgi:hypothetical protein
MVYIVLSFILALFFIFETIYVDRVESAKDEDTNPIVSSILMMAIIASFFTFLVLFRSVITPSLFSSLMKICFFLEGCMLINIAFCYPYYSFKYSNVLMAIIKFVLYACVFYITMFKFREVRVTFDQGILISSDFVLPASMRNLLPITWVDIFEVSLKFVIPTFCCLVMLICNELRATKLEKFKGYIYMLALMGMWVMNFYIHFASKEVSCISLLRLFSYIPLFVIIPIGSNKSSTPSGRATLAFIVKAILLYLIPAAIIGCVSMLGVPFIVDYTSLFCLAGAGVTAVVLVYVAYLSSVIAKSKLGHSADYAVAFEQDLASIDYNGEMDTIANDMFHVFRKNTECSSMAVFINGGQDTFETAYSSNGKKYSIAQNNPIFEMLLNLGKNVLVYSELESVHALSNFKDKLEKFFKDTDSDAMFILNEGRDVHGLMLLGMKDSKDHYKDYDLKVFTKLYSYFFVFGYFMRNIANKEIIGTVNRELRMSSQIITSIQENMDPVKSPKLDAGCIMVPAHNIGGEFVDMIRLTATRHLFVIGSVSGKGIAASMSMVILKAIIRAYLAETHDFKQLVVKINSFIRYNLQKGTLFSGMFGIMNFENDTLYYINCGIPAMFLYTEAYNNVIEIQGSGHILGFVSDISPYISVKQIKLNKSDIVFTCTRGLIESHSLRGEQYGKDRIQRNMVANVMYPAHRMAQFSYDNLMKFMSHELEDDISVLVMKYLKNEVEETEEEETSAQPGKITDSLQDDGPSADDIFANVEVIG